MKIRTGFVSNSSSCSFSIMRKALSLDQFDRLRNHISCAMSMKWSNDGYADFGGDDWGVVLRDDRVDCETLMDNFDLHGFVLEVLMVPEDAIVDYYHFNG